MVAAAAAAAVVVFLFFFALNDQPPPARAESLSARKAEKKTATLCYEHLLALIVCKALAVDERHPRKATSAAFQCSRLAATDCQSCP